MLEKYEMAGKKLYVVFIDPEKTFDRLPRKSDMVGIEKKRCDEESSIDHNRND